ncbi:MAG TPA: ATP-binding protein [Gaiellaceae bacterium]|nr:ATP-binding protein [Gaiellaceae bacterium]
MSVVLDLYLDEHRALVARLRSTLSRLGRNRSFVLAAGAVGLLATFAGMLATGGSGSIGTIMFVPWVALLAVELGPAAGGLVGVAATALYFAAAETVGLPDDPLTLALRLAPLVAVGVAAGLSSRRIASDALELQSTNALQQALLDSTVDGICLTDTVGNLVFANVPLQRYAVELGLPLSGTVAERLEAIADRTTEPVRYRERMRELARDLSASEDEFELADSGRVFRGYTAPVARKDGTVVGRIWTLREVTADRRLERLRDAFVAAVSHELRTPLTSISGFLELLADEEHELSPAGRRYVDVIRRGNARLRGIVEDLLLVAEIEAERLELRSEPTDLSELATATVEAALPAAAENGIQLLLDLEGRLPLEADAGRLRQVLDNLVSNALKYTPDGGTVILSARNGDGPLRVEVTDTGIGIPKDELGQLFSRFYRASTATRRAIPGTGLGLVIARAIVEGHGGTISLASAEGEGTRVTVTLPSAQAAGATYR